MPSRFGRRALAPVLVGLFLAVNIEVAVAAVTFLGLDGAHSAGRVAVAWTVGGVADSSVDGFALGNGLWWDTSFSRSVYHDEPAYGVSLNAYATTYLSASGNVDDSAPIAQCAQYVDDAGSGIVRRTQSLLDLSFRFAADQATVYWGVAEALRSYGTPGPFGYETFTYPSPAQQVASGPPGTMSRSTVGSVSAAAGAVAFHFVMGALRDAGASSWTYSHTIDVYLSPTPFDVYAGTPWPTPPGRVVLDAPSPNPSSGRVTVAFGLPHGGHATVAIFDLAGRRVATLVDTTLPAGAHVATWDGHRAGGGSAEPGVYFARLASGRESLVRRIVRVR